MTISTKPIAPQSDRDRDPSNIDGVQAQIGQRIRQARLQKGISQVHLGKRLGVSAECIAAFERGTKRLATSTLFEIGVALNKPILYFFNEGAHSQAQDSTIAPHTERSRESYDLIQAFESLPDANSRREVLLLLREINHGFKVN